MPPSSATDCRAARRRGSSRRSQAGFAFLLDVLVAFVILAVVLTWFSLVRHESVQHAASARDLRDVRMAGDTVFRKFVYEMKVEDGETQTFDVWYGEFIGLRGAARDRWAIYRGVVRKKKGLAAGTDPTGQTPPLFGDPTSESESSPPPGSGTTPDETGEEVYVLTLDVYVVDSDDEGSESTPVLTLSTVVPVPRGEQEQGK